MKMEMVETKKLRALEYVFPNQAGEAYKRIEKSFDRAKKRAGIPKGFTFHDLRHTFITHALDRGVPILVVASIVGAVDFWWDVTKLPPGPEQQLKQFGAKAFDQR